VADIFISYKKERRVHAERLAAVLEAHGYEVWWDYELAVGPDFRDQIEAKLELARLVIVLWCSGAVKSRFVRSEASRADKRNKLIQCYLEWVEPPVGFEEAQGQPLVNWAGEADEDTLAGLLVALKSKLGERRRAENVIRLINSLPALPRVEPMIVTDPAEAEASGNQARNAGTASSAFTPPSGTSPSAARWALIARSLDPSDYDDFLGVFPKEPEAFDARRHKRQLENWSGVDHASSAAISAFLADPARGQKLFEGLVDHAQRTLERAAEAERRAREEREAREAALQAKADADARARREWEARLGPDAVRAALAAKAGQPVTERVFPVRLEGVSGWPVPQMVAVPPGRFLMGSPSTEERWHGYDGREEPQHEVAIDYSFALGQHAVTFAEWDAALAAGVKLNKPEDRGWGRDRRPVINVSWDDAMAYLGWLNERLGLAGRPDAYRLPSEAEWEYACRAGTTTPFSTGGTITPKQANYDGNYTYGSGPKGTYHAKTQPVSSYPSNAFGLYDMHGNVWEWCADQWHETYQGAPADGSVWDGGDASRRVVRGGSWLNDPQDLRSASRNWGGTTDRGSDVGFRVARTL
jgi:formylglycine-generating enzyme required for sulfatase activity